MAEAIPIVDAHVHLWNPDQLSMPWLENIPALRRPYGLQEYREQTWGLPIAGMVYVEVGVDPQQALREARHVVELAREEPRLQAIVAAAPGDQSATVRGHLEALIALSPLVKGVRRNIQDEAEPDFCLRPDFVEGVRLLAEYGLSFDLCIRHWQLPFVVELVRKCPDTRFILDHLGKPDTKQHVLDPWREHVAQLAALPNVWCKVSGLVTEADPQRWTPEDLAPYVAYALEVFGEDRVAFGGDWPGLLLASSYDRWIETLDSLTRHLSPEVKRKL
jgi:L-fuconolactonase